MPGHRPPIPSVGREAQAWPLSGGRGSAVYPGSPSRCACQPEEVPRTPGAFSGSWTRRSGWRAPRTAWCSSASVPPLRREELELEVREGARAWGLPRPAWELESVFLEALGRPALGEGSAPAWGCLHLFVCSFTHVSITCSERALIYMEASCLMGPLSLLGVRQGWETTS